MKPRPFGLCELFDVLPDGVLAIDGRGVILFANATLHRLLGYTSGELVGRPLATLLPERYREAHETQVREFHVQGSNKSMGARPLLMARHQTGRDVVVSISLANVEAEGERYSVAVVRDAAPLQEALGRAQVLAETDPLTGITNRLGLSRHLQAALGSARPFGLLFIDLVRFKDFNDRHGHRMGDLALCQFANRVAAQAGPADVAARVGGDEFVLSLDGVTAPSQLAARAHEVVASVSGPLQIEGSDVWVGANAGGALFPGDGETEAALLDAADRNMYLAKERREPFAGPAEESDAEESDAEERSAGAGRRLV